MSGTLAQSWNQLVVSDRFSDALAERDPFEALLAQNGQVVREAKGRRTIRFSSNGHSYFAKLHTGVGWGEIFKNAARLRWPVVSAEDEWRAIHRVRQLGIRTAKPIAFGCRGANPARLQSFIVTADLGATITLAALADRWRKEPGNADPDLKRRIIDEVARIARIMHENGINHRDFYLCHFRIEESNVSQPPPAGSVPLYLMDLHRAQIRHRVPRRWLIKDLASLLFSSFDAPISLRDVLRFMRGYSMNGVRTSLTMDVRFWEAVFERAKRMYRAHRGKTPRPLKSLG